MSSFTRTEFRRRIRYAARAYREAVRLPDNYRVEVGRRVLPVAFDSFEAAYADSLTDRPGDDLDEFYRVDWIANGAPELRHGSVVHLYFSSTGDWGQLESVGTVWIGTPDEAPGIVFTDLPDNAGGRVQLTRHFGEAR